MFPVGRSKFRVQVTFAWHGPDALFPAASIQLEALERCFDLFEATAVVKQVQLLSITADSQVV